MLQLMVKHSVLMIVIMPDHPIGQPRNDIKWHQIDKLIIINEEIHGHLSFLA